MKYIIFLGNFTWTAIGVFIFIICSLLFSWNIGSIKIVSDLFYIFMENTFPLDWINDDDDDDDKTNKYILS